MKGVKKILIGLIIILVVYFGYELYLKYTAEQPGFYDFENGIIQEQIEGDMKIITEEGLGLTMRVPSDWEYEAGYGYATLKDSYINVDNPLRDFRDWTEGCSIELSVENDEIINGISTFDEVLKNKNESSCDYDYCELINIDENEGIKKVQDFDGDVQYVDITILSINDRRIYRINSFLSPQVPECEEHLNNFINSLEFK